MHKILKRLLGLSFIAISAYSCSLFGGDELRPAYVHIEPFTITSDVPTQGSPTEKVVDGWVYMNGQQLGVFELPVTIPVLDSGLRDISVFSGVKENGITAQGDIYPFYRGYEKELDLVPFETDTITPTSSYQEGLSFLFLERFEIGNAFNMGSGSDVGLEVITDVDLVLEGNRSAVGLLGGDDFYLRVVTDPLNLPPVGSPCWAEIDYRSNNNFDVWLTGYYPGGVPLSSYLITIVPRDEWNKIYLNIGAKVQEMQADSYSLEIRSLRPVTVSSAWLYLDNIKIIAF